MSAAEIRKLEAWNALALGPVETLESVAMEVYGQVFAEMDIWTKEAVREELAGRARRAEGRPDFHDERA